MRADKYWLAGFHHHTSSNSSVLGREEGDVSDGGSTALAMTLGPAQCHPRLRLCVTHAELFGCVHGEIVHLFSCES